MSGHFARLPEEKRYTADLLQRNRTWRRSLERHDPGAPFGRYPAKRRPDAGASRSEAGVGGGEEPVKSCEICPSNNRHLKSICSTSKRGKRTTEECAEWAVTMRTSKSISQTNTQQPECQRGEMAAGDGNERDKNIILLSFSSPPFFLLSHFLLDVRNVHTFPYFSNFISTFCLYILFFFLLFVFLINKCRFYGVRDDCHCFSRSETKSHIDQTLC